MKKLKRFFTILVSSIILSCTLLTGCGGEVELPEDRPDYSNSDKTFTIWAYSATQNNWYQMDGVKVIFDQGVIQSPETTKLYKDANFNMLFINSVFSYNTQQGFKGTQMEQVMDWAHAEGIPCFVFNNVVYGLSTKKESNLNKDKAINEINNIFANIYKTERVSYFDAYDYCKTNHNNCTSCTEENLPEVVKANLGTEKTLNEIYSSFQTREFFYNEQDLDRYVGLNLRDLKDHPAFRGISLKDEPFYEEVPQVGEIYRSVMRVLKADDNPANDDAYIMSNLLPFNIADYHKVYFAGAAGKNMSSEEAYKVYMDWTYEHITQYSGYYMYDDYPILEDAGIWSTYLQNHKMVSDFCKEKGLQRRMVMQTTAYSNRRATTEVDMYFQANISQAFGNKDFSYYTYYPTAVMTGGELNDDTVTVVNRYGVPNERYYWVKNVNAEMAFNGKALMHFEYQGMSYKTQAPMPGGMSYVNGIESESMTKLKDYSFTVNLQTGGMLLVTELYDAANDQYGYYVVNASNPAFTSELVVTLDFGEYKYAQIYQNSNVVDAIAEEGKVTVYLGTGRGAFVMPY